MHYPFVTKQCDFQNGLDKLELPKWVPGIANICTQLQDTIFKPFRTIHVRVQFPADSPLIPVPVLLKVEFQNGETIVVPDVMWISREEFFQFLENQAPDEVPNQLTDISPSANDIQEELSPAQIVQKTSLFVLQYKNYISVLQHFLETITQPQEEQSLVTGLDKSGVRQDQLEALRKLKGELLKIAARIDAELFEYSTQRNPYFVWREWNDLAQFKEKIESLLNQLNAEDIRQHLSSLDDQSTSKTVLADIIGLRREVADEIFQDFSDHESEEDLIHRYIDAIANSLGTNLHCKPIQKQLVSLGYTEQRATFIANKIRCNNLPQHHLSVLDFAHIFIQDLFKYDVLLTDTVADLPDCSKGFNNDYFVSSVATGEERMIPCMNFNSSKQDLGNIRTFFTSDNASLETNQGDDNFEYWFHATDSSGACSILEDGIDLHKGMPRKDFSDGKGFYMSDGFKHAHQWTLRRFTVQTCSAILRFKIPKSFWDDNKDGIVLCLDNKDDMQKWKDIIRYNRSKKKDAKKWRSALRKATFIMGPLSSDGFWEDNQSNPDWPFPLKDNWKQLCICNEIVGDEFNIFLDKIAFINKPEEKRLIARKFERLNYSKNSRD